MPRTSGLLGRIVVATDDLSSLFTVLYQRQLHFGTRAGLSGPTTGPRRFFTHDPLSGWIHHKLAFDVEKLAIEREDCVSWHLCTTCTLLEVHTCQTVCHFAEIPHGF